MVEIALSPPTKLIKFYDFKKEFLLKTQRFWLLITNVFTSLNLCEFIKQAHPLFVNCNGCATNLE